ncbi:MAG: glycerol-3-phosphate dehydrogenase/oxidase [Deltaproteobacteria bacterium]|nr:glycerol-3-phosphate dehydrogenase/oxidase [Deltaproteobacteria bacterium]
MTSAQAPVLERFIEAYDGDEVDLLIIGGGITGAALAYDAALRGLSVALVEKRDFGCATSSVTSKLIHGGFRYLANMELGLVRESLRERRTLENIAPNFVYPLPSILCAYDTRPTNTMAAIRTGMALYEVLSYDKGKTWDKAKAIPSHRMLTAEEALALEPAINAHGLKGAGLQYDCASISPERLTLAFIRSAAAAGARVANYAKVERFLEARGRIRGVVVHDLLRDRPVEVHAKLTVNCSGPWADLVLGLARGGAADKKLRRSEGIHVITKKLVDRHLVGFAGRHGGHFFLIPWRGHTLIGTTDKEYVGDPDQYRVTREAIEELLAEVNDVLGRKELDYDDVVHAYGGLRPLVEDQTKSVYESSRRYEIHDNGEDGLNGMITVEGGKYTTSRNLAETAMKMIEVKLGRPAAACETAHRRLVGCEIDDVDAFVDKARRDNPDLDPKTVEWIARHYGTEMDRVLSLARRDPPLARPLDADGEIAAQVVYAVRAEMARTLEDIVLRRTGIGTLGFPGDEVLATVADVAARELGWDDARKQREVAAIRGALTLPQ